MSSEKIETQPSPLPMTELRSGGEGEGGREQAQTQMAKRLRPNPEENAVTSRAAEAMITSPSTSRSAGGGGASSAEGAASRAPAPLSGDEDLDSYKDDCGPRRYTGEVRNGERHVPLNETVTLPPRDILKYIFSMQGVDCDPSSLEYCVMKLTAVLTERCQSIDSTDKEYDCFISYRMYADKDVAEKIYLMLKLAGLKPFLYKNCMPCGEGWKTNFLKALRGSKFFVALISTAGLAPARNAFIDHSEDSVLLEYQIATEINQKRRQDCSPAFIIPVLVGHVAQVGGNDCLTKFGPSGFALDQYSDSVTAKPNPKPEEDAITSRAVEAVTGRVDAGQWSEDRIEGRGKMTAADGSVEHVGLWINDEPMAEDPVGQHLDQVGRRNIVLPDATSANFPNLQPEETEKMIAALNGGKGEWLRSKIMIIGQGRAGKSCFARNIIGDDFMDTPPTIGIEEFTCSVKHVLSSTSNQPSSGFEWSECARPENVLESSVARMMRMDKGGIPEGENLIEILQKQRGDTDENISAQLPSGGIGSFSKSAGGAGKIVGQTHSRASSPLVASAMAPPVGTTVVANMPAVGSSFASSAIPASALPEKALAYVDKGALMKCLASEAETESGLLLSVFDYGGQEVFDTIHHLFLTSYGVYALCFNMQWLQPTSPDSVKQEALAYIKKWLNNIALHTRKESAPVFLIGTHADVVSNVRDHRAISKLLCDEFHCDQIVSNELENLCFFPVSNKIGRASCPTSRRVMQKIEAIVNSSAYTHAEVPLTWLQAIDEMNKRKRSTLTYDEVRRIACDSCGVEEGHVKLFLYFLNEMGAVLWLDEPGLRELVVLDVISFFVKPASLVICNHGNADEAAGVEIAHSTPLHADCKMRFPLEWKKLVTKGILSTELLPILWKDCRPDEARSLLLLMSRFGLLVPILNEHGAHTNQYIAPALLPKVSIPGSLKPGASWAGQDSSTPMPVRTCYFVFTIFPALADATSLNADDLKTGGFLPPGMFERLVGRCLQWISFIARDGLIDLGEMKLESDLVQMAFGAQLFCMVPIYHLNCIRVETRGSHTNVLIERLLDLCRKVIRECMQGLCVFAAIPIAEGALCPPSNTVLDLFERGDGTSSTALLALSKLRSTALGCSPLKKEGRIFISLEDICNPDKYGKWLISYEARDSYDVFLSYRQSDKIADMADQNLVNGLFDSMGYLCMEGGRGPDIFLDSKRLQDGEQFDRKFAKALVNSLVVVTVCSHFALTRMTQEAHRPEDVDYLLLEWMLAVECQKANEAARPRLGSASRVQFVIPLLFGKITQSPDGEEITVADIFEPELKIPEEKIMNKLSDKIPTATIAKCKAFLLENGVTPSDKLDSYTVKSFIRGEFQPERGYAAWKSRSAFQIREISSLVVAQASKALKKSGARSTAAAAAAAAAAAGCT